jgi:AcrR family transcriptional regulator
MTVNIPFGMADDKTDDTRTRLLAASAEVFAKKGYERASVDDVAHAAGFTKGAVYWNFSTKEELFLALVRERQSSLRSEFFAAAAEAQRPDAYVSGLAEVYRRQAPDPDEWKLWMEFTLYALRKPRITRRVRKESEDSFQALVADLDQRMSGRPGKPPLPTESLARLYVAIFDGLNQQRALDPGSVDDELFPTLLRFVEDAYIALTR